MTHTPDPRRRLVGYLEAIAAACLWGSSGIFAVHLMRLGVPPESLALLRPLIGLTCLVAVIGVRDPGSLRVTPRVLLLLTLGGGVAVGVFQLAYQLSTDAVGVPTTVALLYLAPAIVIVVSGPLLGEWPTRALLVLAAITLTGVWLSVSGAETVVATFGTAGLSWGILAGLAYATYTLFGRFASWHYGPAPTVVYSTAGACLLLIAVLPSISGPLVLPSSAAAWLILVAFGILTISVAQFLFFDALSRIEAGKASVATAAEPAVAAVLATTLLSQGLSPIGWTGIALVVLGVAGVGVVSATRNEG